MPSASSRSPDAGRPSRTAGVPLHGSRTLAAESRIGALDRGFGRKRVAFPFPRYTRADVELIKHFVEAGEYRAVVDRHYPLEQFVEATRYVETETKTGSVALRIADDSDRTTDPGVRA